MRWYVDARTETLRMIEQRALRILDDVACEER
jgi:hypothetical protein